MEGLLASDEFMNSVKAEHEDNVAMYLEADATLTKLSDALSRTALHIAAGVGNLSMCRNLVQHGAGLNALDNEGNSALFYALRAGRADVVAFLLQEGAECKGKNHCGLGALHLAAYANDEVSMRRLLAVGGWDLNLQNDVKQTALHVAAHRASTTICDLLVQHGADPQIEDLRGHVPAQLARRMSKIGNEKCLSQKARNATTVVRVAIQLGHIHSQEKSDTTMSHVTNTLPSSPLL